MHDSQGFKLVRQTDEPESTAPYLPVKPLDWMAGLGQIERHFYECDTLHSCRSKTHNRVADLGLLQVALALYIFGRLGGVFSALGLVYTGGAFRQSSNLLPGDFLRPAFGWWFKVPHDAMKDLSSCCSANPALLY